MKENLLAALDSILLSPNALKFQVEEIYQLRLQLDDLLTPEEKAYITDRIRDRIQVEAYWFWQNQGNNWSAVLAATGTGKSKIGIYAVRDSFLGGLPTSLIVVPTEKLRDENWKDEFYKWGYNKLWDEKKVERSCYASLQNIKGREFGVVVLDEGHNITELNSTFFLNNKIHRVLWLSATKPRDIAKKSILMALKISPVYEITLDEAVKLGLVAPFDITVVTLKLNTQKNIKVEYTKNGAKKEFYTSEHDSYQYLSLKVLSTPSKENRLKRMRFIYDLKSKTEASKYILSLIPQNLRTIIFCGSKNQANEVCEYRYYSRPNKPPTPKKLKGTFTGNEFEIAALEKLGQYKVFVEKMIKYEKAMKFYKKDIDYTAFKEKRIDRLACVEALNEGENIPDVDVGVANQLNSNELDLIQRIGRTIRFRVGHNANIIILAVEDTEDITWVKEATKNLDSANIRWVRLEDIKSGAEKLNFN